MHGSFFISGGNMHIYFHILGLNIPSYGLMIATGVVLANIIAAMLIHFTK